MKVQNQLSDVATGQHVLQIWAGCRLQTLFLGSWMPNNICRIPMPRWWHKSFLIFLISKIRCIYIYIRVPVVLEIQDNIRVPANLFLNGKLKGNSIIHIDVDIIVFK